jgi:ATP-dependent helicase/nuclease subunit B
MGEDVLISDDARRVDGSGALRRRSQRLEDVHDDVITALASGAQTRTATLPRAEPRTGRALFPSRWLGALMDSGTTWRSVDSFTSGLGAPSPALSTNELRLRDLTRWAQDGHDPVEAPAAGAITRLVVGLRAGRYRSAPSFTRFDGLVGPGLISALDPQRPVSATRFETYAKCPRRYLFERVLGVNKRRLPEELWRIEPIERGSLVHNILEQFVVERVAGEERSLERLLDIAEVWFAAAEAAGIVGKALLWRIERAGMIRDLRRFYVEEGAMEPLAAELGFGGDDPDDDPPVGVVLDDGRTVHFRGRVDRVDRTASGQVVVSDYKTGRQDGLADLTKDPVAAGTLLQLPLYGLAARARFGGSGAVHARYWLLSGERSAPGYTLTVNEDVENRFRHVIGLIAAGVESGVFPAVPGAASFWGGFENCSWCDFDALCPTDRDRQWGRKFGAPVLSPVTDLLADPVPEELAGAVVRRLVDPEVDGW